MWPDVVGFVFWFLVGMLSTAKYLAMRRDLSEARARIAHLERLLLNRGQ